MPGVVILKLDGAPISKGGVEPFHLIDFIDETPKVRDDILEGLVRHAVRRLDLKLICFNQFSDLERCALRPGKVHNAEGWREVLEPVVRR